MHMSTNAVFSTGLIHKQSKMESTLFLPDFQRYIVDGKKDRNHLCMYQTFLHKGKLQEPLHTLACMVPGCRLDDALPVSVRLHSARALSSAASRRQHIRIGSLAYLPVIQTSGDQLRDTAKN